MSACIFCAIVAGEVETSAVYADDMTFAFMDLRQPNGGHALVEPRQHIPTLYDLDEVTSAALMRMVVLTARAVRKSLQPDGVSVWQSNGEAAGQEVPHVHFHVLARQPADGLLRVYAERPPTPDRRTLDQLAGTIREGLPAARAGGAVSHPALGREQRR